GRRPDVQRVLLPGRPKVPDDRSHRAALTLTLTDPLRGCPPRSGSQRERGRGAQPLSRIVTPTDEGMPSLLRSRAAVGCRPTWELGVGSWAPPPSDALTLPWPTRCAGAPLEAAPRGRGARVGPPRARGDAGGAAWGRPGRR